jgi:hypothetical protein
VGGLAASALLADDGQMTTPSRAERHAARLARVRRPRWLTITAVVLGFTAGLSLALFSQERPFRVVGIVVVAVNIGNVLALRATFRAQRLLLRAQWPGREDR